MEDAWGGKEDECSRLLAMRVHLNFGGASLDEYPVWRNVLQSVADSYHAAHQSSACTHLKAVKMSREQTYSPKTTQHMANPPYIKK